MIMSLLIWSTIYQVTSFPDNPTLNLHFFGKIPGYHPSPNNKEAYMSLNLYLSLLQDNCSENYMKVVILVSK